MTDQTWSALLSDEHRQLFDVIVKEIAPFVEVDSYPQAIARVDMILRGIPVDQDNRLLRAALLAKRAELHMESDDLDSAEEDVRHAIHNGMRHASVYALSGWIQYSQEQPEKARAAFDKSLDADADLVDALTGRALVLQDLEELDLARADLTHAIHCDNGNATLYNMRGEVYVRLGDMDQALRDLRQARQLDREDADVAVALARVLAARGEPDKALAIVDSAADADDPSLEALLLRSHLRLTTGDSESARADAMTASNRFPDEAFGFVQLATVQLAEGNAQRALKAAERAVKLDPSLPDSYLVRGAVRSMLGEKTESQQDLQRASQAPAELPMFLFGSAYDSMDSAGYSSSILDLIGVSPEAAPAEASGFGGFPGMPSMPGMPGMDPMKMMGQIFDSEGNIKGPFKPLIKMALRNAPSILKNMPPSMLKNMGGVDPEMLKQANLDEMTPEMLESQMKAFYQMMQSGEDPMDMVRKAQEELKGKKGD